MAEWFESLVAETPTREQILNKQLAGDVQNRTGDPATDRGYEGGDDVHENPVHGWNTDTDNLGQ